jgi:RNA polymerase subunit RPABC4/transcription elongation factor Spt4
MFCVKCGSQLITGSKFCSNCGLDNATYTTMPAAAVYAPTAAPQNKPLFCVKCGAELYPKTKVCPNCRFDNTSYVSAQLVAQGFGAPGALVYPDAYCEGRVLVVPCNATLPASCVKCGGTPKEPWLNKNFYWHNPLLYILAVSPLIYVIVSLILRKRVQLMVPICAHHNSTRLTNLWLAVVLLLGFIPLAIVTGTYLPGDSAPAIALLLGFVMLVGGLVALWFSYVLRPTYIGDDCSKFKGAHPEFLARLKNPSIPGMGVQMQSPGL